MKDSQDVADCATEPARDGATVASPGRRSLLRVLLLAAVLLGAMAVVYCSPVRLWIQDVPRVRQTIDALGNWRYPVCALAVAILVSCGIPRLVFCAIGGMILGFWPALIIVQIGTMFGYYSVFLFVRWGGRDWVMHHFPKLRKWSDLIHEQGVVGVMLARQLPIHGTLVNLCLGLSRVKHRHFLLGTAIGVIPEAVPFTLVGAGLVKGSVAAAGRYLAIAAITLGIVWIACRYALRVIRKNGSTPVLADAEGQE
ncbi:MAG: TVP38/TMEM64 family protein [Tepidisphaerales bacterium]